MSDAPTPGRHACAPPPGDYDRQLWRCPCGYSWTYVQDHAAWSGECWLSVQWPDPLDRLGVLTIDRADPVVWMMKELLDEIRCGYRHDVELAGEVVTIRASNRTVAYRVGEYDPRQQAYLLTATTG